MRSEGDWDGVASSERVAVPEHFLGGGVAGAGKLRFCVTESFPTAAATVMAMVVSGRCFGGSEEDGLGLDLEPMLGARGAQDVVDGA